MTRRLILSTAPGQLPFRNPHVGFTLSEKGKDLKLTVDRAHCDRLVAQIKDHTSRTPAEGHGSQLIDLMKMDALDPDKVEHCLHFKLVPHTDAKGTRWTVDFSLDDRDFVLGPVEKLLEQFS